MLYGIEAWGGSKKTVLNKIQSLQNQVTKLVLGRKHPRLSVNQRQRLMKWLPITKEVELATNKQTFKILNMKKPEELAARMPMNLKHLRISKQKKLDNKPKWLMSNKTTRKSYRNRSYNYSTLPNVLTSQETYLKFKKKCKEHMLDKY